MAIFTLAEIETQFTTWKAALLACAGGQSFRMSNGVTDRMLTQADLPEIRKTLEWLDGERQKLTIGSGPQFLAGRPRR